MKYGKGLLVVAVVLISFSLFGAAFGQSAQASYTVKLNRFSLLVTYPAEVLPGDKVTVSVQGTPTGSAVYLQSLTVTVYYADVSGLHQLPTVSLFDSPNAYNNYVTYGYNTGSFNKNFTVNVPENVPRTSLVAIFSETVQPNYYNYGGYTYNYPYYYTNPYTYQGNPYYPYYYPYSQYYTSPAYYPYSYGTSSPYSYSSDQAVAPLSYVKANTPESVTLASENQMLQQELGQVQSQNQELQSKVSQQDATINQQSQQLAGVNGTVQTYQALALGLGVLSVILLAFSISRRKSKPEQVAEIKPS
jgi:hypothetical protein